MLVEQIIVLGHNSTTSTQIWIQDPSSGVWSLLYNHSGVGTALRSSVVGCGGGQIIASIQGKPHHFEGGAWAEKAAISGFAYRLHAANRSYNAVWALCYPSNVYTTIWDGSSWGPSRYCTTAAIDLWAASATEAWVVGTSAILHTTDGGVNWTNLYSQAQSETGINIPVYCVYGWNANEVYFLGHGGSYGASGTRSKLIRWNGANFSSVTMDIIRLDHPTVGHNPPVYGTAGQFWFELWPSYFNQGYCRQFWGISSSQVVFTASEWSWNGWTWNGGICQEREYVGSTWGTGQPRIDGLSNASRIVSVPRGTTAGVVAKETYDGGVTWHAVDASFPSALLYKDIGLYSYTTVEPSVDEESPADGETSVSVNSNIHFHLHKGSSDIIESTILIQLNGVDVWKNGAAQPGFSVVKGSIADGFSFDIDPNANLLPATSYTVYIFAENGTDHIHVYWSFLTSANIIIDIFVVAKDIIMVMFSEGIVTSNEYINTYNYEITNLSGGSSPVVTQILPAYDRISQVAFLKISQLELGSKYKLLIKQIYNSSGKPSSNVETTWIQHKTKVDIAISSFADMWNMNNRSVIRSIIEAVMMSDEKIGGDY